MALNCLVDGCKGIIKPLEQGYHVCNTCYATYRLNKSGSPIQIKPDKEPEARTIRKITIFRGNPHTKHKQEPLPFNDGEVYCSNLSNDFICPESNQKAARRAGSSSQAPPNNHNFNW